MTEKKILLVDYDGASLESLRQLFRSHRFEVITATDGLTAFEKFKEEKPDAVVLEAILPKIHGFDLTKRISEETHGRVPVVIVTGLYRGPQYRSEALTSFGASDYFEKPVDKERLVRSVINLLSEEEEIGEDLPDPDSVLKSLAQRLGSEVIGENQD